MTRAEIVDTGQRWVRSASLTINAPASEIFDVIRRPAMHSRFDGSGTVQGSVRGPERLELGSRFGMAMRIKVPYTMTNEVVEFEPDRLIAWRHIGRHRWRYELKPINDGTTLVTETFDGSTAVYPPALKLINAYDNNEKAAAATLVRLKKLVESGSV